MPGWHPGPVQQIALSMLVITMVAALPFPPSSSSSLFLLRVLMPYKILSITNPTESPTAITSQEYIKELSRPPMTGFYSIRSKAPVLDLIMEPLLFQLVA